MLPYLPIALSGLTAPLLIGAAAAMREAVMRRQPPAGLVIHSLLRRSPIDCAWVCPDRLRELIRSTSAIISWSSVSAYPLNATPGEQGRLRQTALLCFDDGHESVYHTALPILRAHNIRATLFAVSTSIGRHTRSGDVYGTQSFMSVAQIREWVQDGNEVGSHTCTHAALPYLSQKRLIRELADSRKQLEDMTGAAITSLSFPNGCWNRRVWDAARDQGYLRATVSRGRAATCEGLLHVRPAHCFDTAQDLYGKLCATGSVVHARARVMEQFSRGTPLWRFRDGYQLPPFRKRTADETGPVRK